MAEDGEDASQKTEDPTPRRLEDALKKGQVINSREVTNFLMLLTLTVLVIWMLPGQLKETTLLLRSLIEFSGQIPVDMQNDGMRDLAVALLQKLAVIFLAPISVLMLISVVSSFLQTGQFIFTYEPLSPDLSKISLLRGIKRLFSLRSIVEFLKGLLKIIVVGTVFYLAISPELRKLKQMHDNSVMGILSFVYDQVGYMLIAVCIITFFVAVLDYMYQRYEYLQRLRMSKFEIKEELKQSEGSPEVRSKLRQLRMERAKKRMMSEVPTADVVITNPTHFAVALKYDMETMPAPVVVAKGADIVAMRIRDLAREHHVPVISNPPLARALHETCALEDEVPTKYYQAVAEIINYVFRLKGKTFGS